MTRRVLPVLAMVTLVAAEAGADSFRCPNGAIVSTGDNQSVVAMKCDPPTYKATRMESEAGHRGATLLITVEEWTYNEGPHRLVHILTFRNGVLSSVQTAGYGK